MNAFTEILERRRNRVNQLRGVVRQSGGRRSLSGLKEVLTFERAVVLQHDDEIDTLWRLIDALIDSLPPEGLAAFMERARATLEAKALRKAVEGQ